MFVKLSRVAVHAVPGSLPPPSPVRSIPAIPDSVQSTPGQLPQRRPVSVSSHVSQDAAEPPAVVPPPPQGKLHSVKWQVAGGKFFECDKNLLMSCELLCREHPATAQIDTSSNFVFYDEVSIA